MPPFDVVVISCDTNPKFIDFWPYVRRAWKALYPRVEVLLGVVGAHGTVPPGAFQYLPVEGIPVANQSKLLRYWMAARIGTDSICSINDIDLIPISRTYINQFLADRPPGHLVRMGAELYTGPEAGKATSGYLTAECHVWRALVNPNDLNWPEWVRQFVGLKVFDHKEDVANATFYEDPNCFSDESWLRAMISINPVPVLDRVRGYYPYTVRALCRSDWNFNPEQINNGTIVEAHLPRPLHEHRDKLDPLFKLLQIDENH